MSENNPLTKTKTVLYAPRPIEGGAGMQVHSFELREAAADAEAMGEDLGLLIKDVEDFTAFDHLILDALTHLDCVASDLRSAAAAMDIEVGGSHRLNIEED